MDDMRTEPHEKDRIADEARAWLGLLFAGEPTASDRARFETWLDTSPDHRAAFEKAEEAWSALGLSDHVADWVGAPVSARPPARPEWAGRGWTRWAAGAASIAAAAVLAIMAVPAIQDRMTPAGPERYVAGIGQTRTIELDDGTVLTLGASTAVDVLYARKARRAELLRGSAFFDVAHDPDRPLRVEASNTEILVLGTAFGVRLGPKDVSVSVSRGTVGIVDPGSDEAAPRTTLSAGRRVVADLQGHILTESDADLDVDLAWMEGHLAYDGASLADVIADINRYRAKRIEIADPELADLRITVSFRADQSEQFLAGLPAAYPVSIRERPDRTVIVAK